MKTIYSKQQIQQIDHLAADYLNINSFELMQKAGAALFSYIQHDKNILIVTGAGNNAGDGFIMAEMALQQGNTVTLWSLIDINNLPKDANKAAKKFIDCGGVITNKHPKRHFDCIVDAIFGTGLNRNIEGEFSKAIDWINTQKTKVVSVDIPSGLDANTGSIKGCAICADITITVICYKAGLITNNGKDYCGQLFLEDLGMPEQALLKVHSPIKLLDKSILKQPLFNHKHNSHKGLFGQALVIGGYDGMLGALILAGKSALRSGCGTVEVVSNSEHAVMISIHCPELITANSIEAARFTQSANVIAIGPGLGLNQQSKEVLEFCIQLNKPMVIDADAITLIAQSKPRLTNTVLTPHPKEAATLLNTDVASIQADRISAATTISQKYQAVVILKGSGTVIADVNGDVAVCPFGYPGMATAGMGDVLTGMVASLMAQGFSSIEAAKSAVVWHAVAAENCQKGNTLIASDVIHQLHREM